MKTALEPRRHINALTALAALVIIIAGLQAASSVLAPILLAAFIALLCTPVVSWLTDHYVPKGLAITLVVLLLIAVLALVGVLAGASLTDFSSSVPVYQSSLQQKAAEFISWLEQAGVSIPKDKLLETLDPGKVLDLIAMFLTQLAGLMTNGLLMVFTLVFILIEAADLPHKLKAVLPDPERSFPHVREFERTFRHYIAIKIWISLATGIAATVLLIIVGVSYPVLWGVLAFLFNFIPNIGSILAALPPVLLALIQLGLGPSLATLAGYLVINNVIGNIIEPRVMGHGLGLSPLVVFLSLLFWGWVLGVVGMLLAVPLTMLFKIALGTSDSTRWISVLLGSEVPAKTHGSGGK